MRTLAQNVLEDMVLGAGQTGVETLRDALACGIELEPFEVFLLAETALLGGHREVFGVLAGRVADLGGTEMGSLLRTASSTGSSFAIAPLLAGIPMEAARTVAQEASMSGRVGFALDLVEALGPDEDISPHIMSAAIERDEALLSELADRFGAKRVCAAMKRAAGLFETPLPHETPEGMPYEAWGADSSPERRSMEFAAQNKAQADWLLLSAAMMESGKGRGPGKIRAPKASKAVSC